jgi:benzoyl-CoA reductase/2-hydroxyglutaryl-CoA dehydratase subunit BcrC/BadD/HgdB
MLNYFAELETGLASAIAAGNTSPRKLYTLELARLGKRLYSTGNKVAWCGITAPFDLFNAMNVTSCFVEFIGAMLASSSLETAFIEEADTIGYSSDACSYHRSVTGAAVKGLMPNPEFLVATSSPCSGGMAVIENLASHFQKKLYVLHVPQDESGKNVRFLTEQLENLTRWVDAVCGIRLQEEDLRRAVINTNQARQLMVELYELTKQVPSPTTSRELSNVGIALALFLGTDAGIAVAKAYRDEFRKRVAEKRPGLPAEKHRLLWIQNRVQFKHPLEKLLAEDYQAVIVTDELNDITWDAIDPDEPYVGMARRSISIPLNGTIAKRIEHLKKLAEEYKVDGAINPCNWGCRQGAGARGLIEEGLREIDIPVLNLEVDCIDSRKFTEGQFRTRIEAFMEMIESKPSPWT